MNKHQIANMYADLMLKNKCTLGECGQHFQVPKSTVHWRIHHYCTGWLRIKRIKKLLQENFADGPRRGGQISRYRRLHKKMEQRYLVEKEYVSQRLDTLK